MKRLIAGAVLALVTLAGCSGPETGLVYQKKYEAPYQWTDYQCVSYQVGDQYP